MTTRRKLRLLYKDSGFFLTNTWLSNSRYPSTWSSTAVQALFNASISDNSTPSVASSASPPPPNLNLHKRSHIIIGVILGAVAAAILLGLRLLHLSSQSKAADQRDKQITCFSIRRAQKCAKLLGDASDRAAERAS